MQRVLLTIILTCVLTALWIVLSGKFDKPILNALGAVSVLVGVILSLRMKIVDTEAMPYLRIVALARYWFWLAFEMGKSNIAVARLIMKADLDFSPRMFRVPARQKTPLGVTLFANSITLTPGTVSVALGDDHILVHAIDAQFADIGDFEEMARRATEAGEGRPW